MKRKAIGWLFCAAALMMLAGCGKDAAETSGDGVENAGEQTGEEENINRKKVAVFLDGTQEDAFTEQELFVSGLDELEYEVDVILSDSAEKQIEQMEKKLEESMNAWIIEAVDAYGLNDILKKAEELEIPVIAYEELIMDTAVVSYYATYSYREMGQMVGEAIKKEKNLEDAVQNQLTYNMEFLMGSQDSIEALFFYNGVMEILQEYFDAGVLICPSGKNSFDANGILRWDEEQAGIRLQEILESSYQEGATIDIICTGFDAAALRAIGVLEEAGYDSEGENWPLITGIGCVEDATKAMEQGKLYCSVYMDKKDLVDNCIKMADACVKGEEVEINDSVQYDNGVKIIEAHVCEAKLYTSENINKLEDTETSEKAALEETINEELDAMSVEDF